MRAILLASICLAATSGCGHRGPEVAPVSGKVTYAGKPVTEGTITFQSNAAGTVAMGQIGADGSYRLTTHPNIDGAAIGSHQVTVRSLKVVKQNVPDSPKTEKDLDRQRSGKADLEKVIWLVPERYEDRRSSPLTAEVKPGPNTIDFNLPAER
jgi:hypothetical protein